MCTGAGTGCGARSGTVRRARAVANQVGIQASDLARSVDFYTQVLGLREIPAPFPPTAARWLSLGSGRMLNSVANGTPGAPHNYWDHVALACADLDAMIARLDARQIAWADMDGHRASQAPGPRPLDLS